MSAPKNYTVRGMVKAADESAIRELMLKNPLWSRRTARECVARKNFAEKIKNAGRPKE